MSRRIAERDTRRRFILEAARALFAEKGVESTTMDDIAAAAEYTRRTLYAYFPSRDDICLRVHVEDVERRWARQQQDLAGVEGGWARLETWARSLHAYWKEHPQAMRMERYWDFHGVDRERIDPDLFERFETLNDDLADGLRAIVAAGIADGSLRADLAPDAFISQFLYALRAVLGRALSSSYSFTDVDPDGYVDRFLDLLARGVGRAAS